ncbi:ATP-binding protein [Bacillus sp. FJAT-27251]|uniref:ATP-binding protein n=1 Tax=Bacillus sp. FJAT-27251 TaxID=1684142 RepID=UPI0006A7EBC6|nr:ATP-binding protein [Bacillus sp. FJAT-27251]
MDLYTKELIISFLLALFPLFIWQLFYLLHYIYQFQWVKKWMFAVFPLLSIILCMTFPIALIEPLILDLRRIPLILGTLYGGYRVGFLLLIVIISLHYLFGGEAFYNSYFILLLTAVCAGLLSRYYVKVSLKKKILISSSLILLSLVVFPTQTLVSSGVMTNIRIEHLLINVISMVIFTVLAEVIMFNFDLLQKSMKAQKLEVASNLAASISHEIGNPLTATRGFIQLLSDEKISFETRERYLKIAAQELDQAIDTINDYLIFANPAYKEKEEVFIFKELKHVVEVLSPLAKFNNVKINTSLIGNEDYYVLGERKKFNQCLLNFVKNGIESMPKGGELQICLNSEGASTINLSIKDEGIGMSKQQMNRLGEPYFTTKENGTGLGLMVAYSVIKSMGGEIDVQSELGKGTCISINLPQYFHPVSRVN